MLTILAKGQAPETGSVDAVPFVGAYVILDGLCEMGVGYYNAGGGPLFWGVAIPCNLLQSWRAAKLLEKTTEPWNSCASLCAAWYVVERREKSGDRHYMREAAQLFASPEALEKAQTEIMCSVPSDQELCRMLTLVNENKIELDDLEEIGRVIDGLEYDQALTPWAHLVQQDQERKEVREKEFTLDSPKTGEKKSEVPEAGPVASPVVPEAPAKGGCWRAALRRLGL